MAGQQSRGIYRWGFQIVKLKSGQPHPHYRYTRPTETLAMGLHAQWRSTRQYLHSWEGELFYHSLTSNLRGSPHHVGHQSGDTSFLPVQHKYITVNSFNGYAMHTYASC